jgi:hypothetical protein
MQNIRSGFAAEAHWIFQREKAEKILSCVVKAAL